MALSKPTFFTHLKTLTKPHHHPSSSSFTSLRLLSFSTPEEAAADRRRRKRRLRIEPPLTSVRPSPRSSPSPRSPPNPNSPKLPEPLSSLSGPRLNLHNRILTLIRQNDLDEASLLTRHSIYSNCRPTIFTVNAVLSALLRQSRYSDLLSLHRFVTQAGVPPNIVTHNLLLNTFLDCRKNDTALEHYKQLINDAPFIPSPTTYRILIKGLIDNNNEIEKAMELKDEILNKGLNVDPVVYNYLMTGMVKLSNSDGVFTLYEELREKLGGFVEDGIVYGNLMKGYFMKGMERKAMEIYEEAVGGSSRIRMGAVGYNSVLDALSKNGKFDVALKLFDKMMREHDPPKKLSVNLGSFNVMVDGYCGQARLSDAIEVFNNMGEKRCRPDTLSFNNLIQHLCDNRMLGEAEEIYKGMSEKGVNPDEFTFALLMDSCFKADRADDAAGYFRTMVDSKLRPNLGVYNKLVEGLVKVGKVDEAKSFYDLMIGKLKMDDASYEFLMRALFEVGKADEVLKMVGGLLRDEGLEFTTELQEFVKGELSKGGTEEDLVKLMEEVEREKAEAAAKEAEAAEKAKSSARAAISSLLPSKFFGTKESEEKLEVVTGYAVEATSVNEEVKVKKEKVVETSLETGYVDAGVAKEETKGEYLGKSDVPGAQVTV